MKYYWMQQNEEFIQTVAYCPKSLHLSLDMIAELSNKEKLPFEFELRSVSVKERLIVGNLSDICPNYLSNNFGCSILSPKIKQIVDNCLFGSEDLKWIRVLVKGKNQRYDYYIPYFCHYLDTLDKNNTRYIPNTKLIINPAFDYNKYKDYAIFHSQYYVFWQMSRSLYVNQAIKEKVEHAKINDIIFEII